ncbi:MAG: hypothetical protein IMX00_09815 [Limnochordales bacterium]|nr:hypothetical protein [Limnochordales bacterium]
MPDVEVRCPVCRGRRFKEGVLEVRYKGYSIAHTLDMTIAEAAHVFHEVAPVYDRLLHGLTCRPSGGSMGTNHWTTGRITNDGGWEALE